MDAKPVDPTDPDVLDSRPTPGGGVEHDESFEDALQRELLEMLGLGLVEGHNVIGTREVVLDFAHTGRVLCNERNFAGRLKADVAPNHDRLSSSERDALEMARWWNPTNLVIARKVERPRHSLNSVNASLSPGNSEDSPDNPEEEFLDE